VTFPALLFAGLNPIDANASSVVALFPGTFAGAWAYRQNILAITQFKVRSVLILSLAGGLSISAAFHPSDPFCRHCSMVDPVRDSRVRRLLLLAASHR
jgi:hypothetical protein